ncbi:hypothetical protein J6590_069022 [Homalodisca vitripennis]|nr:hypothetical protein J6590_069022 [Homalodisca vitripennis]
MDFDDFLSLWAAVHTRVPHGSSRWADQKPWRERVGQSQVVPTNPENVADQRPQFGTEDPSIPTLSLGGL